MAADLMLLPGLGRVFVGLVGRKVVDVDSQVNLARLSRFECQLDISICTSGI